MSQVSPDDPVEAYVTSLGRRLRGPWRMRRGLLAEVRDGLDDAAEALVDEGRSWVDARRIAVHEFGPVGELAPEFQRELAVVQARRTAIWAALVLPALWLAWDLTWATGPDLGTALPAVMVLARVTDVLGIGTALLCVVALLVLELAGGRLRAPERLARGVARAVTTGVFGVLAASAAMTSLNVQEATAITDASAWYRLVAIASLVGIVAVLLSAIRCSRAAEVEVDDHVPTPDQLVRTH